jgi:hypothetical protein
MPSGAIPNGLGINIHFTQELAGEMDMLAATGVTWIRMDWGWGRTEKQKGVYDFSEPDKLVKLLEKYNLKAIFILSYGNKLYSPVSPATPESREAFARWAVTAAKRYAGKGILWEMWNEPNIKFWRPKPNVNDYIALAKLTGEAFKREVPNEAFIGPTLARMDWEFFEACFKGGLLEYFDAVSVHPYRNTAPDTVAPDYGKLRLLIDKYAPKGKTIPILSGEWGYSSAEGRLSEEQQARYLARQWLVNIASGVPISIWYDWRDDGDDPKEIEHRFGMVRRPHSMPPKPPFEAKPAYGASQTLINVLRGYRFEKRLPTNSEENWVLQFRRGKEIKWAAWTSKSTGGNMVIPFVGKAKSIDLMGKSQKTYSANKGILKVPLSPAVMYLTPIEQQN